MNTTIQEDDDPKPLDPAVERVRRKLVRFVAVNLGLLFLALMAVALAIVYKARTDVATPGGGGDRATAKEAELVTGRIPLPAGSRILSHTLAGGRMTFHVEIPSGGQRIYIYDLENQRTVARFDIAVE